MDLNHLLLWMVGASCGLSMFFLALAKRWKSGRFAMALLVGAALLVLTYFIPEQAGLISCGLWVAFMVVPGFGNGLINWLVSTDRFRLAKLASQLFAVLHPFDGSWQKSRFIHALHMIHVGRPTDADVVLKELQNSSNSIGRAAAVIRMRTTAGWQEFLNWVDTSTMKQSLLKDPQVVDAYIQALGEAGEREEMLRTFRELVESHQVSASSQLRQVMRMKVAAFSGATELTAQLLDGPLALLPNELKQYWLATSLQASHHVPAAADLFLSIRDSESSNITVATERRLNYPVKSTAEFPLSPQENHLLKQIGKSLSHESQFAVLSGSGQKKTLGTWILIAVLCGVFLLEIPGGAEDSENLIELGALVIPLELVDNEWWRVVTAGFLHFGYLHLLLNAFGLLLFGQRLERAWGTLLLWTCFLVSSIGSISLVLLLSDTTVLEPSILVGASGGVMGLIGALLGHLAIGMMKVRSRLVVQEFLMLFLIIGLQLVFDANTPIVSSTCHMMGLGIGFAMGLIVASLFRRT